MRDIAPEESRIIDFYSDLLNRHGISPRSLDWGSKESQNARFDILTAIARLDGENPSVLDVGCGLADLWAYFNARGIPVQYEGWDLTPAMIQAAQSRFPDLRLFAGNILEQEIGRTFDYVFASGIFYLRQEDPYRFLEAMMSRLYALCRRGVALNLLSQVADRKDAGEFYADPAKVVQMTLAITPKMTLRHEYFKNDFTVYLYR